MRYQFQINRRPGADRALTGPFDGVIDWHLNWQASNQGNGKRAMAVCTPHIEALLYMSAHTATSPTHLDTARQVSGGG